MKTLWFTKLNSLKLLIVLAAIATYAGTLRTSDFYHDDEILINENPQLKQGLRGVPAIFSTGYWEAVQGDAATVQEYRPVLMFSFLFQSMATGLSAPPMHWLNLLLHVLVCLLLFAILEKKISPQAAAAGALIYAVMPIHTEAVSMLTSRSELLSAALLLGAWLCLDEDLSISPSLPIGCALYGAALLSKESSILFPFFLALNDWVFHGRKPWQGSSRNSQIALWAVSIAYFILRCLVLRHAIHGGIPYFTSGRLIMSLTVSKFMARHYFWPSLSGTGLCTDYSRPLIPDSSIASFISWLCLLGFLSLSIAALWALTRRRSHWAFWFLGPCLFLLPTSHLIFSMDTLGAERFLYLPTVGLAAGWGYLYQRLRRINKQISLTIFALIVSWYAFATFERNRSYQSHLAFYEAATTCNPVSARAASALGGTWLEQGKIALGIAELKRAIQLSPGIANAYYNLGKFEFARHNYQQAEPLLRHALALDKNSPDTWTLLALIAQNQGRLQEAAANFKKALEVWPWHAVAEFDLGRLYLLQGQIKPAQEHFQKFLNLTPNDPDAPAVRQMLSHLTEKENSTP